MSEDIKEEAPPVPQVEALAAAAIASSETVGGGRLSLLSEEDAQGKRKFFPRVKHLITNKEWEDVSVYSNIIPMMRNEEQKNEFSGVCSACISRAHHTAHLSLSFDTCLSQ